MAFEASPDCQSAMTDIRNDRSTNDWALLGNVLILCVCLMIDIPKQLTFSFHSFCFVSVFFFKQQKKALKVNIQ